MVQASDLCALVDQGNPGYPSSGAPFHLRQVAGHRAPGTLPSQAPQTGIARVTPDFLSWMDLGPMRFPDRTPPLYP